MTWLAQRHRRGQLRRHRLPGQAPLGQPVHRLVHRGGSVYQSRDGKIIRVHPIRHDRSRELGAFANPKGRPCRKKSAIGNLI
jgi:hypothetical protein